MKAWVLWFFERLKTWDRIQDHKRHIKWVRISLEAQGRLRDAEIIYRSCPIPENKLFLNLMKWHSDASAKHAEKYRQLLS